MFERLSPIPIRELAKSRNELNTVMWPAFAASVPFFMAVEAWAPPTDWIAKAITSLEENITM